jgi:hypothetical protein
MTSGTFRFRFVAFMGIFRAIFQQKVPVVPGGGT